MDGALAIISLWLSCVLSCTASQECGGILTDFLGEITSPGYPQSYPSASNCRWEIQVSKEEEFLGNRVKRLHVSLFMSKSVCCNMNAGIPLENSMTEHFHYKLSIVHNCLYSCNNSVELAH